VVIENIAFSLSATVTIVCLFTPKLYIVLLHPEKNIRQSMMNQSKYQQSLKNSSSKQTKLNEGNESVLE
jgi:metabotropic X receptor